jgi:hypothetical protein
MNHPNREELVGFLYQELTKEEGASLAEHLKGCAECRAEVEAWRAVRRELKEWQPSAPVRRQTQSQTRWWDWLKLASTAAVLVCAGFALARLTPSRTSVDTAALRVELRQELRVELAKFSADQATRQQEYQAALARALGQLEARRLVDYVSLRKDVETVAVRAEDELQPTRQGLLNLARLEQ